MDNKFLFLVFVFFLVLGTFATAVFFDQSESLQTRASNQCEPDAQKSLIVSFPKSGLAPGEACEVSVFVRCTDESSVTGANVQVSAANATVEPADGLLSDESGQASFSVTPNQGSVAAITATINGSLQLPETVTCSTE